MSRPPDFDTGKNLSFLLNSLALFMQFSDVIGQNHLKSHLQNTLKTGRVPHAQLFSGVNGSGLLPMAIAYAGELLAMPYEEGSSEKSACLKKVEQLAHPDLHFVYPVTTNDTVKSNAVSSLFSDDWRKFVLHNPYGSLFNWFQALGVENKQGAINVKEAQEISKKLSLKSYEGGYRMAEKMNTECANEILKLVEEPPSKTLLLLLTENEEQIISTILSRCQTLHFPLLSEEDIASNLVKKYQIGVNQARKTSRQAHGDFNKAIHITENDSDDSIFEGWFIEWVRTAFKAKGNKGSINDLLGWSDTMSSQGREAQKKFLSYAIELFRQALLKNYKVDSLLYFETSDPKFSIEKFAPFVHPNNIFEIIESLETAMFHVERNGNSKIIFTDLSIQLTRLIHRKAEA